MRRRQLAHRRADRKKKAVVSTELAPIAFWHRTEVRTGGCPQRLRHPPAEKIRRTQPKERSARTLRPSRHWKRSPLETLPPSAAVRQCPRRGRARRKLACLRVQWVTFQIQRHRARIETFDGCVEELGKLVTRFEALVVIDDLSVRVPEDLISTLERLVKRPGRVRSTVVLMDPCRET